jgi:hypothetical protein
MGLIIVKLQSFEGCGQQAPEKTTEGALEAETLC